MNKQITDNDIASIFDGGSVNSKAVEGNIVITSKKTNQIIATFKSDHIKKSINSKKGQD